MRHSFVTYLFLSLCVLLFGMEYVGLGSRAIFGTLMFGNPVQVWRLFTPCLLHANIFHLVFNMMWFVPLGLEMEQRIRPLRYLVVILTTGILSNVAEYLVAGPRFLGSSGVVCGMVGFIASRQRVAPWERYSLNNALYSVFLFFIFALAAISTIGYVLQFYFGLAFPIGFANAAHIAGLAAGLGLGRLKWFNEQ